MPRNVNTRRSRVEGLPYDRSDPSAVFGAVLADTERRIRQRYLERQRLANAPPKVPYVRLGEVVRAEIRAQIAKIPKHLIRKEFFSEGGRFVHRGTGEIIDPSRHPRDPRRVRTECESRAAQRRAAVLRSGHGGRNGRKRYRKHGERC